MVRFKKFFLLIVLLFFSAQTNAASNSCASLFKNTTHKPKLIDFNQTITHWYFALELGYHDKWISKDLKTGQRTISFLKHDDPRDGSAAYDSIFIMPKARDDDSSYFAKASINRKYDSNQMELYSIKDSDHLTKLTDKSLNLTWDAYSKKNVVSPAEIETFKASENELSPQRKVTFVTTTQRGRTLAVMRVYDGSPYPASYLGGLGRQHEAPTTDVRLPIERRYPHLPLRDKSEYIFEAGRLAKAEDIQDILSFQFYNLGSYLMNKFGFLGVGPTDYIVNGRLYIEITGRYLETYMKSKAKGGMGFHLYAAQIGDKPMELVDPRTTYKALKIKPNTEDKFVMYLTVAEFVNNFYMEVRTAPAKEAHPDLF